jgi:hypothetical protein
MTMFTFCINGLNKTVEADSEEKAMKEARIKEDDAYNLLEIYSFDDKCGIMSFFRVYFWSISVIILVLRIIPAPLWIFTNSLRWANVPSRALVVFGIANSGYFR